MFTLVRIDNNFPDKLANFWFEVLIVTCPRKLLQKVEIFQVKHLGRSLCDLVEQEIFVHLFKMEWFIIDNLVDFFFIDALCQVPELLQKIISHTFLFEKKFEDLVRSLDELQVSSAWLPNDVKDIVVSNPICYELLCQAPVHGVRSIIVDDFTEITNSLYSRVKEFWVKILLAHLKFKDFQFLHGLRLVQNS